MLFLRSGDTITELTARASAITPIFDRLFRYYSCALNGRVEPCSLRRRAIPWTLLAKE